jgi:hypothetical protein
MSEHTPTPWEAQPFDDAEFGIGIIGLRTNDGVPYSNPTNGLVGWATMLPTDIDAHDTSRAEANAALIVKAVNSHEMLVRTTLEGIAEFCSGDATTLGALSRLASIRNTALTILSHVGGSGK